jgi:preprotein translocase subunit SecG
MDSLFLILTIIFILAAVAMVLIILVQRPQGGGLAGAFGGAGGGGTEGVFGGRVGDALTVMTVIGFCIYLVLAIVLNANIWNPSTGPAPEPTLNDVLFPLSTGEPGFGDDEKPSTGLPLDTGFEAGPSDGEVDESAPDAPAVPEPVAEELAPEEPAPEELAPEEPAAEEPAVEEPAGDGN